MIPGLKNDDKWRMVEDEFAVVAQKFTAHLHATEYQRLKERAKDSGAIQSLSRPVTGPMTANVKRRQILLNLKKSQDRGIKRVLSRANGVDEDNIEELPWAGTNLQDLMNSPRKKAVPITRIVSIAPSTRAAALHRQDSSVKLQSSQSPSRPRKAARHVAAESSPQTTSLARVTAPATTTTTRKSAFTPTQSKEDDNSDSPGDDFFDRRMRERRAQRKAARRIRSSTPDTPEHHPDQKSQKSQMPDALSIPSL